MALTRVTPNIIAVANNVTNKTVGNTTSIPSFTFDGSGVVTSASNVAISGAGITANTVANSAFQTGSVENYLNAGGRPLSNRNLIFNGAMQIAQRNTSVTGITTNDSVLTADRWKITSSSLGTWTMNVVSDGPTSTGLRNSANLICTTANTSPPASSYLIFKQDMEGQMMQSIKKGTPGAEQITVSFWVKSSNTGTFIAEMVDGDNNRSCSQTYTINAANTWEKETITFPADTTGQLDNNNERSMELNFWFGAGNTFAGGTLQTSWGAYTDNKRAVGQLNLANRAGNYIAFTGIQWEVGPVATPFEFRPYGTELQLCMRYAQQIGQGAVGRVGGTGYAELALVYAVPMRAGATITFGGFPGAQNKMSEPGFGDLTMTAINSGPTAKTGAYLVPTISGATAGRLAAILSGDAFFASAEL